jgi:hypothetical protein
MTLPLMREWGLNPPEMVYGQELEDRIDQHNWMSAELHKSAIRQIGISFLYFGHVKLFFLES